MLALGGNVNGGQVYGNWPGLNNDQLYVCYRRGRRWPGCLILCWLTYINRNGVAIRQIDFKQASQDGWIVNKTARLNG